MMHALRHPLLETCFASLVLSLTFAMAIGFAPPAHADGNRLLPYWGQPYPFGYAYNRPTPELDPCFEWRDVNTFFGRKRERVWVCGTPVTSRY